MPRPSPTLWTQPAKPDEPCPCGRGQPFAFCCFQPDQLPLLKVGAIRPTPPITGHAHSKCYMRSTNDCSTKISGEHYVSAAILAEFGNLRTSGLPWFGPGETQVGINALTAKILCTRHNSALSPLDTEGRRMLGQSRRSYRDGGTTEYTVSRHSHEENPSVRAARVAEELLMSSAQKISSEWAQESRSPTCAGLYS